MVTVSTSSVPGPAAQERADRWSSDAGPPLVTYAVTADFVPRTGTVPTTATLTHLAAGNFVINKATPHGDAGGDELARNLHRFGIGSGCLSVSTSSVAGNGGEHSDGWGGDADDGDHVCGYQRSFVPNDTAN
jgi:hypothetical protein